MKKNLIAVSLLVAVAGSVHAAGTKAASIAWAKAYKTAASASKSSGKLLMIDFYTDWCGWCKKLDADTYPAPSVVAASKKFVPVKLNAEKDADGIRLAKKFQISGYPTILFIDSNENLVYKVVGYQEAKDFTVSLNKAATIRHDRAVFEKALAKNGNDVSALLGLAGVDASIGETDKAAHLVTKAEGLAGAGDKGQLATAYNEVGDAYQNDNKIDLAIPYFQKAIDPSTPKQSAYARISLAVCYLQSQKNDLAKADLDELMKMGPEKDEYVKQAQQMLDYLSKQK